MRVKIWYKYTKWVYGAILATDIEFNSPHFIELFCFSNKKTSLTSEDHIIWTAEEDMKMWLIIIHNLSRCETKAQGCALAAPSRLRRLTFGFRRLKKKSLDGKAIIFPFLLILSVMK